MTTRIGTVIQRALSDSSVSRAEVDEAITAATSDRKLSVEEHAELTALQAAHADKFAPDAAARLSEFLANTRAVKDLADPSVLTKHATSLSYGAVEGGQLFIDGVDYEDVIQGSIANCYLAAAFSAVAHADPKLISNALTDNQDGTYSVRFFERSGGAVKPVTVTVDGDVPSYSGSGPSTYGKSRDQKELWVSVLEKAYAQWKGGYEAIGNGGRPSDVITAITGKDTPWFSAKYSGEDEIYRRVAAGGSAKVPMTAPTFGKDDGVNYSGTGVSAWHVYTVLGAEEDAGTKYIKLRNPWGHTEHGSDAKNDGIFRMKLSDFCKLYQGVYVAK